MSRTNRLKVSHDIRDLAGSSEGRVLVMKDKSVLEEDESDVDAIEVEDIELAAAEREARRKRLADHGKGYNPLDPDQAPTGLLSKYDDFEEIEKQREKSKQIDLNSELSRISFMQQKSQQLEYDDSVELPSSVRIQGGALNSYVPRHGMEERLKFQSDFYEPGAVGEWGGFKKVKKEKKKRKIEKSDDEDEKIKVEENFATAVQDDELYTQLARLRRQKVAAASTRAPIGAEYIARTVQRDLAMEPQMTSSMIDFISRIDNVGESEDREEEIVENSIVAEAGTIDTVMDEKPTEKDQPEKRDAALVEEVVVDSGLAGALKFFQSRGFVDTEEHRGGESSDDDIHLERRDEFGRSITDPKEAFKQLSWRFHGKKPGAKKQEKRLRKLENETKSLKNQ